MMSENLILQNEADNDGQSVFLYYNSMLGLYMAFGLSAYYSDMAASPELSFSDSLKMPVALLNRADVLDVRQSMKMIEHTPHCSYRFQTRQRIGSAGYERWAKKIAR